MERRAFGKTDMQLSVLGFGGAEIGFEGASQATVVQLLNEAIDEGLNVIDTAECYVNSEEMIGEAVSKRRGDFFLFTKCGHGETYMIDAWSKADIEKSIERSLKRLQTDYVDLLQLHSCSEATLKKGEVIEALQKCKKAGKIRYMGYSGDSTDALYAINTGAFDTLQTSISIFDQEAIELTVPRAVEKGMGIIAKRPIGNAVWRYKTNPGNPYHQPYFERLQKLKYDFVNGKPEVTSSTALRFTLAVPGVSTMIVGTKTPGRWKENSEMLKEGALTKEQFEAIRSHWKANAAKDWVGQV